MIFNGQIISKLYYNDKNNYAIYKFYDQDEDEIISIVGYLPLFEDGQNLVIEGDVDFHKVYGEQIKVSRYEIVVPSDYIGVINYFASGLFPGIGEKLASKIIEVYGLNAIENIREDYTLLSTIKGISKAKAKMIHDIIISNSKDPVIEELLTHDISLKVIMLLKQKYQEKVMSVLNEDPYQIIDDVEGLGFKKVDELALKLGFDQNDPKRLVAAIRYSVLQVCLKTSSSYTSKEETLNFLYRDLNMDYDFSFDEAFSLALSKQLIYLIDDKVFERSQYLAENDIAKHLSYLLALDELDGEFDEYINQIEQSNNISYSDTQKQAILLALRSRFSIITGGPGTGKTTIIKAICQIYQKFHPHFQIGLTSPTGRAAKRMKEVVGIDSYTIHKLLRYDMQANDFQINETNPLNYDLLIIDEFSMVDSYLFSKLLNGSIAVSQIIILGDKDQLPSVGPGAVLRDLLEIDKINKISLNDIYRQSSNSKIIDIALEINKSNANYDISKASDVKFYECDPSKIYDNIEIIINKALERNYDANDIQVLVPMYQCRNGINFFNQKLQNLFNPQVSQNEIVYNNILFRENDKVIQLKNRSDDNVFNGDLGVITKISNKQVYISFDENDLVYEKDELLDINLAYCISIHKAQGSEYPIVILPFDFSYKALLKKNLIYTAVTRAKKSLIMVGDHQAFEYGVMSINNEVRLTNLVNMINEYIESN